MRVFAASSCLVAEGPRWRAEEDRLYWVDLTGGTVFRKQPGIDPGEFETFAPNLGKIGSVAFAADGRLLLFAAQCKVYLAAFGGAVSSGWTLPGHTATRFNDVIDAGDGVFFCGVAPIRPDVRGELWRFDSKTGAFDCIESATAGMPNGMGISPDRRTLYFTVSDERRIYAYDFDDQTKDLSNRRVFIGDFADPGVPDGMCVDPADGSLLVAFWNGFRVERRAPDGRLLGTVGFQVPEVTSVETAGGDIYVTTGNYPWNGKLAAETGAGGVFVLKGDEI